ncbi:MAG: GNAT family N-acetyltransferase [Emcibacteraceae bacterium]|nr:GNAT family N-acetyltransferase [Emcibacteraceae bacterium]
MTFQMYEGQKALQQFNDPDFCQLWQTLIGQCPWSTLYQGEKYACIWFDVYADVFTPILMIEKNSVGALDHLIILGKNKNTNQIFHCGAHQAEYQCWLSADLNFSTFIKQVLTEIGKIDLNNNFTMKFLPAELTQHIRNNSKILANNFILHDEKKPVIQFDQDPAPWQSMTKKGNKSKLSRLKKLGDLKIELLSFNASEKKEAAIELLQQISLFYDLRQGAINNNLPFIEDTVKFKFYLRLLTELDEFKVLAVHINDKVIACVIGDITDKELSVGVFSYDFFLSKHSPGKILLLLGSKLLAEAGLKTIDLTPGGDWKWRYANHFETVSTITFYHKPKQYCSVLAKEKILNFAKSFLQIFNLKPDDIRNMVTNLKSKKLESQRPELRIYSFPASQAEKLPETKGIKVNTISDFLKFEVSDEGPQRQSFLSDALRRFENGQHGYSNADNHHLLQSGWLAANQKKTYFTEVEQEYFYNEKSCALMGLYSHKSEANQDSYQRIITQMAKDASGYDDIQTIYISALSDNIPLQNAIEKIGFEYIETLHYKG